MELPSYFPVSCESQAHILCQRYNHPHAGLFLDNTLDQVHVLPLTTREDVWDHGKHLERIPLKLDEERDITTPFVKIDEETIQHFSHDHHLKLQGNNNACEHEIMFCQACCLQLIRSTERFYGCMQCDFLLHEACACLPRKKYHPLHKYPLTLHSFPPKPNFEAYVKGMFPCDGCDQLNCGFVYKCGEKGCGFQLDLRCASLLNPLIHEDYHQLDHSLFFSKRREKCISCKSSKCSRYLLECRKCNFVLGLKCATLPSRYKHDRHLFTLCYGQDNTKNRQYWCEICELGIDAQTWFYTCDSYKVNLHVECLLGRGIYMKPHQIISINDEEEIEIVRNNSSSPVFCFVCGRQCIDTLIFKWLDRYSCTFLCIVTFFL